MSLRTRHALDIDRAAPFITELMPVVGDGDLPEAVTGWRDDQGRIRRVRAIYPNGVRVELRFSAKGELTWRSASLRLVSEVRVS